MRSFLALSYPNFAHSIPRRPLILCSPSRRPLHAPAPAILPQKSIFDLRVNAMKPLLGPLGSFPIRGNFCLELRNPIFGRAQPMRKLLRHIQRVPAVVFGDARGFMKQLQDRLSCLIEAGILRSAFSRKPDHRIRPMAAGVQTRAHRMMLVTLMTTRQQFRAIVTPDPQCRYCPDRLGGLRSLYKGPPFLLPNGATTSYRLIEQDGPLERDWDASCLFPVIEDTSQCFAEDRLIFGSDWPVCTLAGSYGAIKCALDECLTKLGALFWRSSLCF